MDKVPIYPEFMTLPTRHDESGRTYTNGSYGVDSRGGRRKPCVRVLWLGQRPRPDASDGLDVLGKVGTLGDRVDVDAAAV